MRNLIIFDTANVPFHNNQVFDPEVARLYPGALTLARFGEMARHRGYEIVTCDLVDSIGVCPKDAILVTEQWSPYTIGMMRRGALPGLVMSYETLWHAWFYYSNLSKISSIYRHVFGFEGQRKRVKGRNAVFHTAYFPEPFREVVDGSGLPWCEKRYIALINSNKCPPSGLHYRLACLSESALRTDLYSERLRGIKFFRRNPEFHLYGRGWSQHQPWLSDSDWEACSSCFKGECDDKIEALSRYRFSLCFENTRFDGYITEKIFDCFFAGSIPIYYGAPDIEKYVPKEAFIDFRDFAGYEELDAFLENMTDQQAAGYLDAARAYLASPAYEPFYQDSVAQEWLDAVDECTRAPEPVRGPRFNMNLAMLDYSMNSPVTETLRRVRRCMGRG